MSFGKGLFASVKRATLSAFVFTNLFALSHSPVFAAGSVTLTWSPSADPNVAGYRAYYGAASRDYTNVVDVGSATSVTISNLVEGATYYFAATAYNILGMESDFSDETSYTVPGAALVNQPPTLNALTNLTLNESAGLRAVNLTGISSGASNEVQTLTVTATSSNPGLIPTPAITYTSPNATGTLTFTPVTFASGVATLTVTVNDGGASNNIVTRTFTVTVNPVNNTPTLDALGNVAVNESAGVQTVNLTGISSGATNEAQTLTVTASSSNPGLIPTPVVAYSSPNAIGTLNFTPVAVAFGSATITVTVNDGGTSNNIVTRTFTVTVSGVNNPPTLSPLTDLTINESAGQQTVNLTGIGSGATNESQTLTVTAVSSNPGLIPTPTITYTSPNATGTLRFTPVALASGVATLTVTVNDGGTNNNLVTQTFTVTVRSVNNAPTLDAPGNVTLNENAGPQTVNLTGISSGATNESQTLMVTASSSNPALIPTPAVTYTSPAATGTLTYTPVALAFGSATVTVTVNDGGASNNLVTQTFTVTVSGANNAPTLNSPTNLTLNESAGLQTVDLAGISSGASNEVQTLTVTALSSDTSLIPTPTITYTSPNAMGTLTFTPVALASGFANVTVTVNDGGASNNIVTRTFTVTVNPVNNSPTLGVLGNVTVNESVGLQTVNLTGIGSGASNEVQTLTVTASSSNPALIPTPTVTYATPSATGTLNFTPVALVSGSATITVTINDGSASNNIVTRTFTVTVNPVNNTPTLDALGNLTLAESAGLQTVSLTGISSGASNEVQTLTVTAVSSNPALIPTPSVTYTSPNATGTLTFTPLALVSGSAAITVTVNDGGTSNNIVTRTFTVTINGVNNAPTLDALGNVTVNESAGLQTVNLTGIGSGASNEVQTLTLTAASSNPGLIPTPAITYTSPNATGTLSFTPVALASGSATITVTVNDGGASNNIVTRTFTLTVNPVNNAPTLSPLGNLTLNVDAGLQTVNLTGISSGATNEFQTLTVTAASSNPGLIPTPAVTYASPDATGTIEFTPAAAGFGTAVVTVTVNDGGASNNVVTRTFTITVAAPPTITAIANQTIGTNSSTGVLPFTIGDPDTVAGSLTVSATSSLSALVSTNNIMFGGSDSNRTVTVTPLPNQSGTAKITILVSDGSSTASTTFDLHVLTPPTPPSGLTVITNGGGSVTPNLNAQNLIAGKTYTLTATPAADQLFAGWSGSITSSATKITFVMRSNLVIQANFIPNPYAPMRGNYNGLFYEEGGVQVNSAGFFTMSVTTRGTYSGRLQCGSSRYSFRGQLNAQGLATNSIARRGTNALTLALNVGGGGQPGELSGRLTDGFWISGVAAKQAVYNARLNPAPYAGKYTMIVPGQTNDPALPMGHGYGTLRVDGNGGVRFAGVLADGTRVSQSALLSRDGQWPLYAPLYSGGGLVMSWMTFTNLAASDLNGDLVWIKQPNARSRYYPGGFNDECEAAGSVYVAPAVTNNVLNFTNGNVALSGGNLGDGFTTAVAMGPRNTQASGAGLTMKFSTSTGTFSGRATDPVTSQTLSFGGAVLQKLNAGYGFQLGTNQSSQVMLSQ